MFGQFTDQEVKIEQNEQLINNLKNFVASKEEYMNPEPVLGQNRDLMEQMNQLLLAENVKK